MNYYKVIYTSIFSLTACGCLHAMNSRIVKEEQEQEQQSIDKKLYFLNLKEKILQLSLRKDETSLNLLKFFLVSLEKERLQKEPYSTLLDQKEALLSLNIENMQAKLKLLEFQLKKLH